MKERREEQEDIQGSEKPPVLGSWRNVYIFVLAFQAVLILFFALLMLIYKI